MRPICRLLLSIVITVPCGLLYAADEPPAAEKLQEWVRNLGDEDYATRRNAEDSLRTSGEPARAPLEAALKSRDAEVVSRAKRLLATLKTEPILKRMETSLAKTGPFSADMEMSMKVLQMKTVLKGKIRCTPGNKFVMDLTVLVNGQNIPSRTVSDGTIMWTEFEINGKKMVQKFLVTTLEKLGGAGGSQNPLSAVRQMRKTFLFTDVLEDKLDGHDVFIVEGKLREGTAEQQIKVAQEVAGPMAAAAAKAQLDAMEKTRLFIDKQDLLLRRSEVIDQQGEIMMSMELKNLKTEELFDEKQFTYTPPEGVTVMDMEEQFKLAREAGAPGGSEANGGDE